MMLRAALIASACLVALGSAEASTRAEAWAKKPQSEWMKIEAAEAKAKEAGYQVSKSKISGACHEVYATKDSRRFELFYNPENVQLVETVAK